MTKKEKEIFRNLKDKATSKYLEALNSGVDVFDTPIYGQFIALNNLWFELYKIEEQGA